MKSKSPIPVEEYLYDYTKRLAKHLSERHAIHIRLSQLRPHHRREHHLLIAYSTFERYVKKKEGQIFILTNQDIVFILKGQIDHEFEEIILKLRFLFSDDPLIRQDELYNKNDFYHIYHLETHFDTWLNLTQTWLQQKQDELKQNSNEFTKPLKPPRKTITTEILVHCEKALYQKDLSNFFRTQPLCILDKQGKMEVAFREFYLSIEDLQEFFFKDIDLQSNKWLFHHLCTYLDDRMLSILTGSREPLHESYYTINLRLETIVSKKFLLFEQQLKHFSSQNIIIELHYLDIMSDFGFYLFAKDYLRERGFRICLDGITHLTLPYIDTYTWDVDFVKLFWSDDFIDDMTIVRSNELKKSIETWGVNKIILARCDNEHAISFGQSLGIYIFQGFYVDYLLKNKFSTLEQMTMREAIARGNEKKKL